MGFPTVLLVIILYLILKSAKASGDVIANISSHNMLFDGQCINTVEDLLGAFNTGLKTNRHTVHHESDSLLHMSARRIQSHSLIIIRLNTTTPETNSTRNYTNTCCSPGQEGCIVIIAARKHVLHIFPPLLLYALGAPLNRGYRLSDSSYPVSDSVSTIEEIYCWTPPKFCFNVGRTRILKDFITLVS